MTDRDPHRPPTSGAVPSRLLGVDLGDRRVGIAVGDLRSHVVTPLTTFGRARKVQDDAVVVARLASEQRAGVLVVGLPLDMDGTEGLQAAKTREWVRAIEGIVGLPVRFRDERLTSVRAEQRLGSAGRGSSGGPPSPARREAYRARIDREAAALILQDEMDALEGPRAGGVTPDGGLVTPEDSRAEGIVTPAADESGPGEQRRNE